MMIERGLVGRILNYMMRSTLEECIMLWFGKTNQTDREIKRMFLTDVLRAALGQYDHWQSDTDGLVALLILNDQFRRNIFRNSPGMYTMDEECVWLVKYSFAKGMDEQMDPLKVIFLCLVLTHSEELEDQELCLQIWAKTSQRLKARGHAHVADRMQQTFAKHFHVIKWFGRFPHRNGILGREHALGEEEFLVDTNFRFDLPYSPDKGAVNSLHI